MHRRRRESLLALLVQLFGLESMEQRLIDAWMALGHRAQRMQVRVFRVLPVVAISVALALYAAGMVALTVRKLRSGSAAEEASPAEGESPVERAGAETAEAVQAAV